MQRRKVLLDGEEPLEFVVESAASMTLIPVNLSVAFIATGFNKSNALHLAPVAVAILPDEVLADADTTTLSNDFGVSDRAQYPEVHREKYKVRDTELPRCHGNREVGLVSRWRRCRVGRRGGRRG